MRLPKKGNLDVSKSEYEWKRSFKIRGLIRDRYKHQEKTEKTSANNTQHSERANLAGEYTGTKEKKCSDQGTEKTIFTYN